MNRRLKPISWLASVDRNRVANAWYVPLMVVAMGLMMLRPLLIARIFDASEFAGYIAGLLVSSSFCALGCFGLQSMLQRKMPMDLMAGKELASLVLLVQSIIVALVCVVLASAIVFLLELSVAGLNPEAFSISMLHGLSQQFFLLATIESRSRGEPLRFSCQNLMRAILVVIAAGGSAWFTRSSNVTLLVEAVSSLLVGWLIVRSVLSRSAFLFFDLLQLAMRRMSKLRWLDALALMSVMLIGFALTSVDRWLAASWLPPQQFAWYAFAWILLAASQSFQSIINSSVYPSLAKRYAALGRSSSFRLAAKASVLFLSAAIILAWPAYYALDVFISIWFAEYSASIPLLPVFLAVAAVRLSDFWSSHLVIVGKERLLLLLNVFVGAVILVLWLSFGRFDPSGGGALLKLSWLALALTISNYLFVFCAAVRFRS